ncbi:hypothetical protein JMN32_11800 [Fulvivirga sp. 29W222]|uniref:Lipoprotein n=1 Tax=Fulvivirga marina TaxID=2494733 RepID=A0A937FY89_9BACT|nr:hypothetical protein [Fulvivirga marina]MBL6446997.1 hypothetical protein [Fulvivirga marina]
MKRISTLKNVIFFATFAASSFLFQACSEDENEVTTVSAEEELGIVENSSETETVVDEDLLLMDQAVAEISASGGRIEGDSLCVIVIRDEVAKTITLDFGDSCIGPYGRERSGKIIITYGGTFDDDMANRVITFENYYVNNKKITGAILLRDMNRNVDGNLTATRALEGYTIHYPDGNTFVMNGATTREWIEGEGDGIVASNVFKITGAYEGVSTRGRGFTHTITEPIIMNFGCRANGGFVRISGVKEMVINGIDRNRTRTVDYGDGSCDNEFTVTINDRVYTVTAS